MKSKLLYALIFVSMTLSLVAQNQADQFIAKNPEATFIGAVMDPSSINKDRHEFIDITVPEEITISFSSVHVKSQKIIPTYDNMMKVVRENIKTLSKANNSFSYTVRNITSYSELAVLFGQKINTESYFGLPQNIKPKKGTVLVDLTQDLFSITMDMPEDGKLYDQDPEVLKHYDKAVYIESLSFGRKVTIVASSNFPEADLISAIKEALSKDDISDKSRAILSNATLHIINLGKEELTINDLGNPFSNIKAYFNEPVTSENVGRPLRFSATYLKDNSSYVNQY